MALLFNRAAAIRDFFVRFEIGTTAKMLVVLLDPGILFSEQIEFTDDTLIEFKIAILPILALYASQLFGWHFGIVHEANIAFGWFEFRVYPTF